MSWLWFWWWFCWWGWWFYLGLWLWEGYCWCWWLLLLLGGCCFGEVRGGLLWVLGGGWIVLGLFLGGCFGCDDGFVGDNGENIEREMDEKEEGMIVLILDVEFFIMFIVWLLIRIMWWLRWWCNCIWSVVRLYGLGMVLGVF